MTTTTLAIGCGLHSHSVANLQIIELGTIGRLVPLDQETGEVLNHHPLQMRRIVGGSSPYGKVVHTFKESGEYKGIRK